MIHLSDDDLVLHYYRDPECRAGVEAHLDHCVVCTGRYSELVAALGLLPADDVPARDHRYGLEIWQRIRRDLPDKTVMGSEVIFRGHSSALAVAASIVLLVAAAVLAGRVWPSAEHTSAAPLVRSAAADRADESRRVLLMSVADHLERSDRVLTEIMNAAGDGDISTQQDWAEDLLWAGRLYRQSALDSGEHSVAALLDDVERTLLDIVHSPARVSDTELEDVRRRVDSAALLFKVRVLRDELHQQETPATLSETS